MPGRSMRLLAVAATLVAWTALATPATALAKSQKKGHPSAVDVYVEQVQTASGHKTPPSAGGGVGANTSVALSPGARRRLQSLGGKDSGLLTQMATHPGYQHKLAAGPGGSEPGTLNSAFDVGLGPAMLFALALATVLLVVVGGGLRGRRRLKRND